jgi:MinD superfamily P-loop ATPase
MPKIIVTEKCIECGECEEFCKNGAIVFVCGKYQVDTEKCEDCGTCLEYCPIDEAIVPQESVEPKSV